MTPNRGKNKDKKTTKKRLDVAIGVIVGGNRILICQRRANDSFGGYWEFPGGKRDAGESIQDCLHRELREELAIVVRISEPLTPISHDYPHIRLTLRPFLCEHLSGVPKPLESDRLKWVSPGQLRRHRFPPANEALVDEVIEACAKMMR